MTEIETVDAEIVEDLTTKAGRAQHWLTTRQIRNHADWREREWAISAGLHTDLGMSVAEFCEAIGPAEKLKPVDRKQVSVTLVRELGYVQRDAAAILGVDHKTVCNDLGENSPKKQQKPSSGKSAGENSPTNDANAGTLKQLADAQAEAAALKQQLADATKPPVHGQHKIQEQLQDKIADLEATVKTQKQRLMDLSSESLAMEDTLKKVATSKDEQERQQVALAALNKIGESATKRAAARIDASQLAWDIRILDQKLDTLIQGKGDDISDNDASAIVRDSDKLFQTVQVLKSRVEINKL